MDIRELFTAIQKNNVQQVFRLVNTIEDVNTVVDWNINDIRHRNVTPLVLAAYIGNKEIVRILIDHHANPNIPTELNWFPIHFAAGEGHVTTVQILLEAGSQRDPLNMDQCTPLKLAMNRNMRETVKKLVNAGAVIDRNNDIYSSSRYSENSGDHGVNSVIHRKDGAGSCTSPINLGGNSNKFRSQRSKKMYFSINSDYDDDMYQRRRTIAQPLSNSMLNGRMSRLIARLYREVASNVPANVAAVNNIYEYLNQEETVSLSTSSRELDDQRAWMALVNILELTCSTTFCSPTLEHVCHQSISLILTHYLSPSSFGSHIKKMFQRTLRKQQYAEMNEPLFRLLFYLCKNNTNELKSLNIPDKRMIVDRLMQILDQHDHPNLSLFRAIYGFSQIFPSEFDHHFTIALDTLIGWALDNHCPEDYLPAISVVICNMIPKSLPDNEEIYDARLNYLSKLAVNLFDDLTKHCVNSTPSSPVFFTTAFQYRLIAFLYCLHSVIEGTLQTSMAEAFNDKCRLLNNIGNLVQSLSIFGRKFSPKALTLINNLCSLYLTYLNQCNNTGDDYQLGSLSIELWMLAIHQSKSLCDLVKHHEFKNDFHFAESFLNILSTLFTFERGNCMECDNVLSKSLDSLLKAIIAIHVEIVCSSHFNDAEARLVGIIKIIISDQVTLSYPQSHTDLYAIIIENITNSMKYFFRLTRYEDEQFDRLQESSLFIYSTLIRLISSKTACPLAFLFNIIEVFEKYFLDSNDRHLKKDIYFHGKVLLRGNSQLLLNFVKLLSSCINGILKKSDMKIFANIKSNFPIVVFKLVNIFMEYFLNTIQQNDQSMLQRNMLKSILKLIHSVIRFCIAKETLISNFMTMHFIQQCIHLLDNHCLSISHFYQFLHQIMSHANCFAFNNENMRFIVNELASRNYCHISSLQQPRQSLEWCKLFILMPLQLRNEFLLRQILCGSLPVFLRRALLKLRFKIQYVSQNFISLMEATLSDCVAYSNKKSLSNQENHQYSEKLDLFLMHLMENMSFNQFTQNALKISSVRENLGIWISAQYVVWQRLRTRYWTNPSQIFVFIEGKLKTYLAQIDGIRLSSSASGAKLIESNDLGVIGGGSGSCDLDQSSISNSLALRQTASLLAFMDALEKNIFYLFDSSSIHMPTPPKAAQLFFQKNRPLCQEWFNRMRFVLLRLALEIGQPATALHHALYLIDEVCDGLYPDLKEMIALTCRALKCLGCPDYCSQVVCLIIKRHGSTFHCLHALTFYLEGNLEKSVNHLLTSDLLTSKESVWQQRSKSNDPLIRFFWQEILSLLYNEDNKEENKMKSAIPFSTGILLSSNNYLDSLKNWKENIPTKSNDSWGLSQLKRDINLPGITDEDISDGIAKFTTLSSNYWPSSSSMLLKEMPSIFNSVLCEKMFHFVSDYSSHYTWNFLQTSSSSKYVEGLKSVYIFRKSNNLTTARKLIEEISLSTVDNECHSLFHLQLQYEHAKVLWKMNEHLNALLCLSDALHSSLTTHQLLGQEKLKQSGICAMAMISLTRWIDQNKVDVMSHENLKLKLFNLYNLDNVAVVASAAGGGGALVESQVLMKPHEKSVVKESQKLTSVQILSRLFHMATSQLSTSMPSSWYRLAMFYENQIWSNNSNITTDTTTDSSSSPAFKKDNLLLNLKERSDLETVVVSHFDDLSFLSTNNDVVSITLNAFVNLIIDVALNRHSHKNERISCSITFQKAVEKASLNNDLLGSIQWSAISPDIWKELYSAVALPLLRRCYEICCLACDGLLKYFITSRTYSLTKFHENQGGKQLNAILLLMKLVSEFGGQMPEPLVADTISLTTMEEKIIQSHREFLSSWLYIVPQLLALQQHSQTSVQQVAFNVLKSLALQYPIQLVFPLEVALDTQKAKKEIFAIASDDASDFKNESVSSTLSSENSLKSLLECISKCKPEMVQQVTLFNKELRRISMLWDELWLNVWASRRSDAMKKIQSLEVEIKKTRRHSSLNEAERQLLINVKFHLDMDIITAMIKRLSYLTVLSPQGPISPHEHWFVNSFKDKISACLLECDNPCNIYHPMKIFYAIDILINHIKSQSQFGHRHNYVHLSLRSISPSLATITDSCVPLPGSTDNEFIQSILPDVLIVPTKTRPREFRFKDTKQGNIHDYLFKGMEDLHLDQRLMQFLGAMNMIFAKFNFSNANAMPDYYANHYSVIPLGLKSGLIRMVPEVKSLYSLYKKWQTSQVKREQSLQENLIPSTIGAGAGLSRQNPSKTSTNFNNNGQHHNRLSNMQTIPTGILSRNDNINSGMHANNVSIQNLLSPVDLDLYGIASDNHVVVSSAQGIITTDVQHEMHSFESTTDISHLNAAQVFFQALHPILRDYDIHITLDDFKNFPKRRKWPKEALYKAFLKVQSQIPNSLLAKEIWFSSLNGEDWMSLHLQFSRSLAVMSVIGYLIGLGDRHLDNIMIDFASGHVIHIDYNVCLDRGKDLLVSETVDFRLTQNLVGALGVGDSGTEQGSFFTRSCERTLQLAKKQSGLFLRLMEFILDDPYIDWSQQQGGGHQRQETSVLGLTRITERHLLGGVLPINSQKQVPQSLQDHDFKIKCLTLLGLTLKRRKNILIYESLKENIQSILSGFNSIDESLQANQTTKIAYNQCLTISSALRNFIGKANVSAVVSLENRYLQNKLLQQNQAKVSKDIFNLLKETSQLQANMNRIFISGSSGSSDKENPLLPVNIIPPPVDLFPSIDSEENSIHEIVNQVVSQLLYCHEDIKRYQTFLGTLPQHYFNNHISTLCYTACKHVVDHKDDLENKEISYLLMQQKPSLQNSLEKFHLIREKIITDKNHLSSPEISPPTASAAHILQQWIQHFQQLLSMPYQISAQDSFKVLLIEQLEKAIQLIFLANNSSSPNSNNLNEWRLIDLQTVLEPIVHSFNLTLNWQLVGGSELPSSYPYVGWNLVISLHKFYQNLSDFKTKFYTVLLPEGFRIFSQNFELCKEMLAQWEPHMPWVREFSTSIYSGTFNHLQSYEMLLIKLSQFREMILPCLGTILDPAQTDMTNQANLLFCTFYGLIESSITIAMQNIFQNYDQFCNITYPWFTLDWFQTSWDRLPSWWKLPGVAENAYSILSTTIQILSLDFMFSIFSKLLSNMSVMFWPQQHQDISIYFSQASFSEDFDKYLRFLLRSIFSKELLSLGFCHMFYTLVDINGFAPAYYFENNFINSSDGFSAMIINYRFANDSILCQMRLDLNGMENDVTTHLYREWNEMEMSHYQSTADCLNKQVALLDWLNSPHVLHQDWGMQNHCDQLKQAMKLLNHFIRNKFESEIKILLKNLKMEKKEDEEKDDDDDFLLIKQESFDNQFLNYLLRLKSGAEEIFGLTKSILRYDLLRKDMDEADKVWEHCYQTINRYINLFGPNVDQLLVQVLPVEMEIMKYKEKLFGVVVGDDDDCRREDNWIDLVHETVENEISEYKTSMDKNSSMISNIVSTQLPDLFTQLKDNYIQSSIRQFFSECNKILSSGNNHISLHEFIKSQYENKSKKWLYAKYFFFILQILESNVSESLSIPPELMVVDSQTNEISANFNWMNDMRFHLNALNLSFPLLRELCLAVLPDDLANATDANGSPIDWPIMIHQLFGNSAAHTPSPLPPPLPGHDGQQLLIDLKSYFNNYSHELSTLVMPVKNEEKSFNTRALLQRFSDKLSGQDESLWNYSKNKKSSQSSSLSVEEQVAALITKARDCYNLAFMYEGWTSWV